MKINKFYIFFLSFLIFITSCQGIKEGLVGSKRSKSSDEFLVQKKNPLVLPPDFESLPTPKTETNQETVDNEAGSYVYPSTAYTWDFVTNSRRFRHDVLHMLSYMLLYFLVFLGR